EHSNLAARYSLVAPPSLGSGDLNPGVSPEHMEPVYRGLGRCACAFWLAVAFDVVGLAVLLIGVFASVFFYDLLIYAGAIVIFLSLIWWVFWYSGNIEVPPAELEDDVGLLKKNKGGLSRFTGAVSRFSSRVSSGIRSSLRRNGGAPGGRTSKRSAAGRPGAPHTEQVAVAMATVAPQATGSEKTNKAWTRSIDQI
uniref:Si:dkeyp-72e1.6 n=1 Tax=Amphiprion percula TaxID=161767 RepID=A0A3P8SQJ0_AMPPE